MAPLDGVVVGECWVVGDGRWLGGLGWWWGGSGDGVGGGEPNADAWWCDQRPPPLLPLSHSEQASLHIPISL